MMKTDQNYMLQLLLEQIKQLNNDDLIGLLKDEINHYEDLFKIKRTLLIVEELKIRLLMGDMINTNIH